MAVSTQRFSRQFIGGEWVSAIDGSTISIVNPATEEVLASVPSSSAADVDRAVQAAQDALPDWRDTTPRQRSELLHRLTDAILGDLDTLAELEALDAGKTLQGTRDVEIIEAADAFRFFAGAARCLEGVASTEYVAGHTSTIRREPLGVVGLITPWNFPFSMAAWKVAPALAAGNTVVLKPSRQTPLSTLRLAELSEGILPRGVLNVITGEGSVAGSAIAAHPGIAMISITGDSATGKNVQAVAAPSLKATHFELGGKTPLLVFDDADIDAVVQAIRLGAYYSTGQDCTAASRIIATDGVFDTLVERLVPAIASIKTGDPFADDTVEMGPVISREHQDRVMGLIDRAVDAGARLMTGGRRIDRPGFFIEPTVLVEPEQRSEIIQTEVFGPVVTVQRARDEAQALEWANDVRYGLASSVWSRDSARIARIARALDFGVVWANCHYVFTSEMPHGGFKESGHGQDLSLYALHAFTRIKHVMVAWGD